MSGTINRAKQPPPLPMRAMRSPSGKERAKHRREPTLEMPKLWRIISTKTIRPHQAAPASFIPEMAPREGLPTRDHQHTHRPHVPPQYRLVLARHPQTAPGDNPPKVRDH